jgi:hypothetical protein
MKRQITLVAQSFGGKNEYLRTILSIWSFYSRVSEHHAATATLLFTDAPEFFKPFFRDLPVTLIELTFSKLRQMRGRLDFLHRIKIAIIEEAFKLSDGNLLYLDGDTFFIADPSPLFNAIHPKTSLMHQQEYPFKALADLPLPSGESFHSVLNYIERNEFTLSDGATAKFSASLYSWNAGVIMLDRSHRSLLGDVYCITDQLYAATKNHASEQFAFSIILQTQTNIKPCSSEIYHYWYRIKKEIADDFLTKNILLQEQKAGRPNREAMVIEWTDMLPGYFDRHQLMLRDNAIQSFNSNRFRKGYYWALRALAKNPIHIGFVRDIAYHTKRFFFKT